VAKELYDGIYSSHKLVFIERIEKNLDFYLKDKLQKLKTLGQEVFCEVDKKDLSDVLREMKENPELEIVILNSVNRYISKDRNCVLINLSSVINNFSVLVRVYMDSPVTDKERLLKEYGYIVKEISAVYAPAKFFMTRPALKENYSDIVIKGGPLDGLDCFDAYIQTDYNLIENIYLDTRLSAIPAHDIFSNIYFTDLLTLISRFDFGAGIFPELCLCLGLEEIMQLKVPKRVQYIRMLMSELFRISSHLACIAKLCKILGSDIVFNKTMMERERVLRVIELITGSRIHPNFIRIGGVKKNLNEEKLKNIKENLPVIFKKINNLEALLVDNTIVTGRLKNIGVLNSKTALEYGVTGPNLRSSAVRYDLRKNRNLLLYKDISFTIPMGKYGDCLERVNLRFFEIYQSIRIINQILHELPEEHIKKLINLADLEIPFSEMVSSVECPHGVFKIYFEIKDNRMESLVVMGPSRNSLNCAERILQGNRVEDLKLILATLDISDGEIIQELML